MQCNGDPLAFPRKQCYCFGKLNSRGLTFSNESSFCQLYKIRFSINSVGSFPCASCANILFVFVCIGPSAGKTGCIGRINHLALEMSMTAEFISQNWAQASYDSSSIDEATTQRSDPCKAQRKLIKRQATLRAQTKTNSCRSILCAIRMSAGPSLEL